MTWENFTLECSCFSLCVFIHFLLFHLIVEPWSLFIDFMKVFIMGIVFGLIWPLSHSCRQCYVSCYYGERKNNSTNNYMCFFSSTNMTYEEYSCESYYFLLFYHSLKFVSYKGKCMTLSFTNSFLPLLFLIANIWI